MKYARYNSLLTLNPSTFLNSSLEYPNTLLLSPALTYRPLLYSDTMSSTYAEFIRLEDIIKNVDKTTGGIVDKSTGLVLDEVEENSFKQIALTWDELPVTTVEDQTGARAARNSKSGMVKLVLNFCVAQELLVESQDRYYPTDRFRSLIENYFDDYRGRFAELMNGGRDATD